MGALPPFLVTTMEIKKQYEINEDAWIHLGNGKLHKGRVVDYFDLRHAGYPKDTEFYVIEIPTEIEPLLEVRTWEQISQDQKGPIGAYRQLKVGTHFATVKSLGKVGISMPTAQPTEIQIDVEKSEDSVENDEFSDIYDPTPEEVNAALERALGSRQPTYNTATIKEKRKSYYRKKSDKRPKSPTS